MKKIRTALGALAFVFLIGGIQACDGSLTAPSDDESTTECYWFDGKIYCSD